MELEKIKDPSFVKKLNHNELTELSNDIRKYIIDTVSVTGGHLSSNLGIVDLTIALHKVFNSPEDKIIFDRLLQPEAKGCHPDRSEITSVRQCRDIGGIFRGNPCRSR